MNPSFQHITMVAIDCDETLLHSDNTVSPYTVDVLRRLRNRGIHITIATGRMFQTAQPVGRALNLGNVPMILFSGCLIQESESRRKLFERTVPPDVVERIFHKARTEGWHIQNYVNDRLLCHHDNWQTRLYERQTGARAELLGDGLYSETGAVNKLIVIDTKERIDVIIDALIPVVGSGATLVRSQDDFLEITAPHVSKGQALSALADMYHVSLADVVSFGNADNDISMLETTGYSVAVSNAAERVRATAREVCAHHNDDGVAHWIEENLL